MTRLKPHSRFGWRRDERLRPPFIPPPGARPSHTPSCGNAADGCKEHRVGLCAPKPGTRPASPQASTGAREVPGIECAERGGRADMVNALPGSGTATLYAGNSFNRPTFGSGQGFRVSTPGSLQGRRRGGFLTLCPEEAHSLRLRMEGRAAGGPSRALPSSQPLPVMEMDSFWVSQGLRKTCVQGTRACAAGPGYHRCPAVLGSAAG